MNDLCQEKHIQLNERLRQHDQLLKEHDRRIDIMEQDGREYKVQIKNLCEQVKSLVSIMKWFIGIWITSLLGFFFYVIQNQLIK